MADQRPAFRFRPPWQPAAAPPRPAFPPGPPTQPTVTTAPTATTPQTAATQTSIQPTNTTTPTPRTPQPPAAQAPTQPNITATSTQSTPETAETKFPTQLLGSTTNSAPTTQMDESKAIDQPTITKGSSPTNLPKSSERENPTKSPAATATPIPTAEMSPSRPPGVAPRPDLLPQSQTSRTESQPSSPSRVTTQPRLPSLPASPSHSATQPQASSQPSTLSRAAPQPQAVSLTSSPSRRSPQIPSTPQTAIQSRPTSLLASRSPGQASASPLSNTTAQRKTTTEALNTSISSSKREENLTGDSSQPSATVISPFSDKQEPKSTVSEIQPLEFPPEPTTISGTVYDSQDQAPVESNIQHNENMEQPSKESEMRAAKMLSAIKVPETAAVTQISNSSTINGKPEPFQKEIEPEETKEVKEVMQETKDRAHDETRHIEADLTQELVQTQQTKDLPSITFQSEQTQKSIDRKEITATSASNCKQIKTTTDKTRNKTMAADTLQKLTTRNGEHIPLHKEIKDDISKLINKMAAGNSKHSIDDRPASVITLAGENRGSLMHVGSDSSRKGAAHIHRGYKIKSDDSAKATTDGEESFKGKSNNPKTKEDQASEAYVNSNVQGINNSILFNSSITERSPGVHLTHSHFPTEPKKSSKKPELLETRKDEFNMTPSQKHTYEPIVGRHLRAGSWNQVALTWIARILQVMIVVLAAERRVKRSILMFSEQALSCHDISKLKDMK